MDEKKEVVVGIRNDRNFKDNRNAHWSLLEMYNKIEIDDWKQWEQKNSLEEIKNNEGTKNKIKKLRKKVSSRWMIFLLPFNIHEYNCF